MSTRSRVIVLSTVLAVNLLFFIIVGQHYPEYFTAILDWLPYNNDVEAAVIILSGLLVAIISGILLFRGLLSGLSEVLG